MTFVPTFVAIDPASGKLLWQREFPKAVRDGAVVTKDSVYLTCLDKHLYRLDRRDGSVVWKLPVGGSADPIAHGDALYLCLGKTIVCIKDR
jgi:outer membrane protein assembly factor BamB